MTYMQNHHCWEKHPPRHPQTVLRGQLRILLQDSESTDLVQHWHADNIYSSLTVFNLSLRLENNEFLLIYPPLPEESREKRKEKRLGILFKRSASGGQPSTGNRGGSRPQNKETWPLCVLRPLVHLSLIKGKGKRTTTTKQNCPIVFKAAPSPSSLRLVLWSSCLITISRQK